MIEISIINTYFLSYNSLIFDFLKGKRKRKRKKISEKKEEKENLILIFSDSES